MGTTGEEERDRDRMCLCMCVCVCLDGVLGACSCVDVCRMNGCVCSSVRKVDMSLISLQFKHAMVRFFFVFF